MQKGENGVQQCSEKQPALASSQRLNMKKLTLTNFTMFRNRAQHKVDTDNRRYVPSSSH